MTDNDDIVDIIIVTLILMMTNFENRHVIIECSRNGLH